MRIVLVLLAFAALAIGYSPPQPQEPAHCEDRITRVIHSDTCGGIVAADCEATHGIGYCCKSAGIGGHCYCDNCD